MKERTLEEQLKRYPIAPIYDAVRRMLPKSTLGRRMLKKLKVYAGPEHPHEAQNPVKLDVAALNPKNARSA